VTRILFVDDERRILDALRNLLRRERRNWEMVFAQGPDEAFAHLNAGPFDIVVCDMRMPKTDGVAILTHVKERMPSALRIVLSGYTDTASALRVVPVAHQVLMKPCDAGAIKHALQRATALRELMTDKRIHRLVGNTRTLPSAPTVYNALLEVLARGTASAQQVSQVVERDPAMTAKLLQVVNSAFFGLPRAITEVRSAVTYLGTNTVRHLVLAVEAFECVRGADTAFVEHRRQHAMSTAQIARQIAPSALADQAFVAGMLHDVGSLLLASTLPKEHAAVRQLAERTGRPIQQVETEKLGASHSQVGGYLLGMWGLSLPIVEAVTYHHNPESLPETGADLARLLHRADALSKQFEEEGVPADGLKNLPEQLAEVLS